MNSRDDFTIVGYQNLIKSFISKVYTLSSFLDANLRYNHLILRHDIDMSLEAALSIAITEGELGVKAHYFVLLRTEMYNLFSEKSLEILNKIIDLGHNIGLHRCFIVCR